MFTSQIQLASSLAQSFKASLRDMLWSAGQIPITALCLSLCKAGDKNADSARLSSVYTDLEDITVSVCVAAYTVIGDATWFGCRKSLALNKFR